MNSKEIREKFINYFIEKDHRVVKSSSLIPYKDPTLLFVNAGMNQFKEIFLGLEKSEFKRAVSIQKCMRVSGKHNDLEQVGKTDYHHTFFEMLGNFSFGDYFKKGAIEYAWELLTYVYKIPSDRLWITIYNEDEESFNIWQKDIGISGRRILRFGEDDNFWAMGETGPCGPCSEIHYSFVDTDNFGEEGNFIELWNLVFMEFNRDQSGNLLKLPAPSIDTGMGMERLASVLQNVKSNFYTDLFRPIIDFICEITEKDFPSDSKSDEAIRVIADHTRAILFLIGDGVIPSNEGRGYVLRRIIRRAFRYGKNFNIEEPFLFKILPIVADVMKGFYPEIVSSLDFITKVCFSEEERFNFTLNSSYKYLEEYIEEAKISGQNIIRGDRVFKLYDTFGFPIELAKEIAEEHGVKIDELGFGKELLNQKKRARAFWRGEEKSLNKEKYKSLKNFEVKYIGDENLYYDNSRVIALFRENKRVVELDEGEEGEVILNITPFYGEAGGQVGDKGNLKKVDFYAEVLDTQIPVGKLYVNKIKILKGNLKEDDVVEAEVRIDLRKDTAKNHTATHLLHYALREVLGLHVKQTGSLVSSEKLRFDFTHFSSLSPREIEKIESIVNEKIMEDIEVRVENKTYDEAISEGAIAIFQEKYGENVRVLNIGGFSRELCGGTHVERTGEIGMFKIISESSISAGVRRIEALTGKSALKWIQKEFDLIQNLASSLNVSRENLSERIRFFQENLKEKERELELIREKIIKEKIKSLVSEAKEIKGKKVIIKVLDDFLINSEALRNIVDGIKINIKSGIIILGIEKDGKVHLILSITKDLTSVLDASELIKSIAGFVGGTGGGRKDLAEAGGNRPENLSKAFSEAEKMLKEML
ncbi:MAG: alanine--tRNA ligase [Acidobacteriota bacterium]